MTPDQKARFENAVAGLREASKQMEAIGKALIEGSIAFQALTRELEAGPEAIDEP